MMTSLNNLLTFDVTYQIRNRTPANEALDDQNKPDHHKEYLAHPNEGSEKQHKTNRRAI